jgi:hypothetical protein
VNRHEAAIEQVSTASPFPANTNGLRLLIGWASPGGVCDVGCHRLVRFEFEKLGSNHIYAYVFTANQASPMEIRKSGGNQEGTLFSTRQNRVNMKIYWPIV